MADIAPGDFVECIEVIPHSHYEPPAELTLGSIYRVRAVEMGQYQCGDETKRAPMVELDGDRVRFADGYGWCLHQFRPIYRPNADLIERLRIAHPEGADA